MPKAKKICVIAPYPHLGEIAARVRDELGLECDIRIGNMAEGLELALKAVSKGSHLLISRGGTAILLRQHIKVPVVDIPVTGYDILDTLAALRGYDEIIGVIGFRSVIQGCQKVAECLGLKLQEFELKAQEEIPTCLEEARRAGIRIIVGDSDAVLKAQGLGFDARLIDSGPESFRTALLEARRILAAQKLERERSQQIKAIVNHISDGVIAFDENGKITVFNPVAEGIFGVKKNEVVGKDPAQVMALKPLGDVLEGAQDQQEQIIHIGTKQAVVNRVPLVEAGEVKGTVITVQDASQIQRVEKEIRQEIQRKGFAARFTLNQIIGASPAMKTVLEEARRFAGVDSTILITGETGTGKEMLAQGIHNASARREGPFVAVNCAAIADSLLESELFGYARGAFTGARREGKMGLFEMAHGGTIFLDEIGEAPPGVQAKLLRVLQERQLMRIGDEKMLPVDVRVIAATNRDLRQLVQEGKFREDLYYRLSVLSLRVPPLRERREDIRPFVDYFIARANARFGKKVKGFPGEVLDALEQYHWPGNVREMENVVTRLVLLEDVGLDQLRGLGIVSSDATTPKLRYQGNGSRITLELEGTLEEMETAILNTILRQEGFNKARAARRLGIDRTTLWRKLNKKAGKGLMFKINEGLDEEREQRHNGNIQ